MVIDKKKVIKGLYAHGYKDCKSCPYWGSGSHGSSECNELAREALSLLQEQEPKQIIQKLEKLEYSNGSFNYFAEWYCPHCNMLILRGFNDPSIKFCYRCGKPILWERTGET